MSNSFQCLVGPFNGQGLLSERLLSLLLQKVLNGQAQVAHLLELRHDFLFREACHGRYCPCRQLLCNSKLHSDVGRIQLPDGEVGDLVY